METLFPTGQRRAFSHFRITSKVSKILPLRPNCLADFRYPEAPRAARSGSERVARNLTGTSHFQETAGLDAQETGHFPHGYDTPPNVDRPEISGDLPAETA